MGINEQVIIGIFNKILISSFTVHSKIRSDGGAANCSIMTYVRSP